MSRCGDCELKDCELSDVGSYECIERLNNRILDLEVKLEDLSFADEPKGEVNAVKAYERASHDLEFGYITLGEFEERIEPLKHLYYYRPRGEWHFDEKGYFFCSECKSYPRSQYATTDFCPNCGAKMESPWVLKEADDE